MGNIFYRTYPKKFNKDKSNLGFFDIYDLDQRFILGKILGIDYIVIEDIFKSDENFLDFSQINKSLGQSRDFTSQISKAHDLSLGIFLRIDLSKIRKINKKNINSILNFWINKGIDGFILDDFSNSYKFFGENIEALKNSYKDIKFILNTNDTKIQEKFDGYVNFSKDKNLYFRKSILKENKNDFAFALNGDYGFYCQKFLDFKHFYTNCSKLMAIISIMRSKDIFIKEGEETLYYKKEIDPDIRKEIFDFYRKIILIRYDYLDIIKEGYYPLNYKNKDILAYFYFKENKALVILNNLSQKDVLLDLPEFFDTKKSKFLVGNISQREIFKNINLRAYESIVFTSSIKKYKL
ncbi:hypothetical protein [Anaerococcus ihuae]|uniref:hypothetical protein n=1 Tax=Anaerococcus ihuae TaxID=2899519 RepID=UPI001F208EB1|nr:hypothetical protein [Anaerococcus ihuae]